MGGSPPHAAALNAAPKANASRAIIPEEIRGKSSFVKTWAIIPLRRQAAPARIGGMRRGQYLTLRMPVSRVALLLAALYWAGAVCLAFAIGEGWRYDDGLRMTAFRNVSWDGRPAIEDLDVHLSNERIGSAPFPDWPVFSIEWHGYLAIERAADYTFALSTDDGSSLEIDGTMVVDNLGVHRDTRVTGTASLTEGLHAVRARYFQAGGHSALNVMWSADGAAFSPLPPSQLVPDAMSYTEYRLRAWRSVGATVLALAASLGLFIGAWPWLRRLAAGPFGTSVERAAAVLERPGPAIASIVVVGGLVRLAVFLASPAVLWPDSYVFYVTARSELDGLWASHDPYRTLLYPWFLAAFLRLGQTPAMGHAVVAVQQAMGLAAAVFVYDAGRRAISPLAGLAAGLLLAVHATALYYEIAVLTEAMFTLVFAVTVWLAVRTTERITWQRTAVLGLATAMLVLVRPVAEWYVVAPLAGLLVATAPIGRRVAAAGLLLACYTVPIVLWMGVNQREYGFFGVALGRGMGLYTRVFEIDQRVPPRPSVQPEVRELWAIARDARWSPNRVRDELNYMRGYTSAGADDAMFDFALETVRAAPLSFVAGTVRQWVLQLVEPNVGVRSCPSPFGRFLCSGRTADESFGAFPAAPEGPSRLRPAVVRYVTGWPLPMKPIVVLAVLGVAWAWRARRGPAALVLALSAAYLTAVPALTLAPQDRFRLPADGLLFLFAVAGAAAVAVAASGLVDRWRAAPLPRPA